MSYRKQENSMAMSGSFTENVQNKDGVYGNGFRYEEREWIQAFCAAKSITNMAQTWH